MKIISEEEKAAHSRYVLIQGLKGCAVGAGVAFALTRYLKYRQPLRYSQFNTSVKTALWAMPTITMGAFFADDGSVEFDNTTYRSEYIKKQEEERMNRYNNLSISEKMLHQLNDNKYQVIVAAWAASLYGSWKLVDRDAYMTRAQKLVQARVYAQAFTVILLLGTLLLSVHEAELQKKEPAPVPEWKKYLEDHEGEVNTTPQPHNLKH